jgi:hypothetical protein
MKTTTVDEHGEVRCPRCGARNSFTTKRTGKGKLASVVTLGPLGLAITPKRLKCNGCGANLKRSGHARPERPASPFGTYRCEKNGHRLDAGRKVCPIDGSAVQRAK